MPPEVVKAGEPILHYVHLAAKLCSIDEGRLRGLRHRTVIDGETGACALALWHEEHLPGFSVPMHRHDCEEIISVISGKIRARIEDRIFELGPDESILIPGNDLHGFDVVGNVPVKLLALFASPKPRVLREDGTEAPPPWEGGTAAQFDEVRRTKG